MRKESGVVMSGQRKLRSRHTNHLADLVEDKALASDLHAQPLHAVDLVGRQRLEADNVAARAAVVEGFLRPGEKSAEEKGAEGRASGGGKGTGPDW